MPRSKAKDIRSHDVLIVYWQSMKTHRLLVVVALFGTAISTIVSLAYPFFYREFIDLLSVAQSREEAYPVLFQIIMAMLTVSLIDRVFQRASGFFDAAFQCRVMADLCTESFRVLLRHSHGFFANNFTGALVQKVNRLSRSFERFWDAIQYGFFPLSIRIIGTIILLWTVNSSVAIAMLVWTILFIIFNVLFSLYKIRFDTIRANLDSKVTGALADAITNNTNIKLFAATGREEKRFFDVAELRRKSQVLSWNLGNINMSVQSVLVLILEFFLLYIALNAWKAGTLSVGTFVLIQSYSIELFFRLWDLGRKIREVYESIADSKEMVEIFKAPRAVVDGDGSVPLTVKGGKIQFQNVLFCYPNGRTLIDRLSFTIRAGERVAFVGPSGAGKTTIINLLLRFYNIQAGSISIDGRNIAKVTQDSVREAIGFVPQEPILFHRTLMENIRYGRSEASDAEVFEASRRAHCDEFIARLSKGYDTMVGERGIKLSGGERQRIAIARAIVKNAPVLVLDEATSSLDSHSEQLIQDALGQLMSGRTTIAIAHRLSTIRMMDRIIVMDKGGIAEEGTHDQLLKRKKGLYRHLWHLQSGGFLAQGGEVS
ncbi:MAG: ABC transporter ATP-binding protein [Patescibacteria group bacterium]